MFSEDGQRVDTEWMCTGGMCAPANEMHEVGVVESEQTRLSINDNNDPEHCSERPGMKLVGWLDFELFLKP